jgi:hypothetical protein
MSSGIRPLRSSDTEPFGSDAGGTTNNEFLLGTTASGEENWEDADFSTRHSKISELAAQYDQLLTDQLEAQRNYYEALLAQYDAEGDLEAPLLVDTDTRERGGEREREGALRKQQQEEVKVVVVEGASRATATSNNGDDHERRSLAGAGASVVVVEWSSSKGDDGNASSSSSSISSYGDTGVCSDSASTTTATTTTATKTRPLPEELLSPARVASTRYRREVAEAAELQKEAREADLSCGTLTEEVQQLQGGVRTLRDSNAVLLKAQADHKSRFSAQEDLMCEYEQNCAVELEEMRQQVRDLKFYLETQSEVESSPHREELQEGSIVAVGGAVTTTTRAGRKR